VELDKKKCIFENVTTPTSRLKVVKVGNK